MNVGSYNVVGLQKSISYNLLGGLYVQSLGVTILSGRYMRIRIQTVRASTKRRGRYKNVWITAAVRPTVWPLMSI